MDGAGSFVDCASSENESRSSSENVLGYPCSGYRHGISLVVCSATKTDDYIRINYASSFCCRSKTLVFIFIDGLYDESVIHVICWERLIQTDLQFCCGFAARVYKPDLRFVVRVNFWWISKSRISWSHPCSTRNSHFFELASVSVGRCFSGIGGYFSCKSLVAGSSGLALQYCQLCGCSILLRDVCLLSGFKRLDSVGVLGDGVRVLDAGSITSIAQLDFQQDVGSKSRQPSKHEGGYGDFFAKGSLVVLAAVLLLLGFKVACDSVKTARYNSTLALLAVSVGFVMCLVATYALVFVSVGNPS